MKIIYFIDIINIMIVVKFNKKILIISKNLTKKLNCINFLKICIKLKLKKT